MLSKDNQKNQEKSFLKCHFIHHGSRQTLPKNEAGSPELGAGIQQPELCQGQKKRKTIKQNLDRRCNELVFFSPETRIWDYHKLHRPKSLLQPRKNLWQYNFVTSVLKQFCQVYSGSQLYTLQNLFILFSNKYIVPKAFRLNTINLFHTEVYLLPEKK